MWLCCLPSGLWRITPAPEIYIMGVIWAVVLGVILEVGMVWGGRESEDGGRVVGGDALWVIRREISCGG